MRAGTGAGRCRLSAGHHPNGVAMLLDRSDHGGKIDNDDTVATACYTAMIATFMRRFLIVSWGRQRSEP
jgi:hypothetical protein